MRQILTGIRYMLAAICTVVTIALIVAYPAGGWTQKSFHTLIGRWYYVTSGTADYGPMARAAGVGGRVQVVLCHASANPIIGPAVDSTGHSPAYPAWAAQFPTHWYWFSRNIGVDWGWELGTDRQGRAIADGSRYEIIMPYWLVVCVATGLSIVLWLGWRRISMMALRVRPRARPGYCWNCGYDLRATPQRCPECGNVPQHGDDQRSGKVFGSV